MIISDEYKKKLDKTAQDKVKSGNWAVSENNGQAVIYPSNYGSSGGVSKSSAPSISDNVAELAYMQKQQKQLELERAKKATLSNLSAEKVATEGQYKTAMNDTATQADIALKNYYESVANRGQTNSGSTAQGELSQNVAKQNAISGLQTARSSALSDIERRRGLAEQGYLDNLNSANNLIDLTTMQNQIDLQREEDLLARQQAEQDRQEAIGTIGQYGNDYTAEIQRREAINPNDPLLPYLKMARQQKLSSIAEQQAQAETEAYKRNLEEAEFAAKIGDFRLLEALGRDTTQLKQQWNAELAKTNRTNTGGSSESKSNAPTVYTKALEMKNKSFYPPEDIVNYILMQGLTDDEEFNLIDSLGYYETYRQMYGGETTQNSQNEQMKKLINRFLP